MGIVRLAYIMWNCGGMEGEGSRVKNQEGASDVKY
jgi:hypothetical protein